jgi:4-hydroxy-tetrahydrodipicolinate synthase
MISGSIVALVTPMLNDGSVDYAALQRLVDWHISSGTNAIVAVGTTGESATLNVEEHHTVIKAVVDQAAGRIAIIAGTGANSTSEAIELTRAAHRVGADACLTVTPYYNKPTQEGLYLHHKAIAEAVDIPNILYNVPGRTAVDMLPSTTARLAELPNIIGIKDATGDLTRGAELLASCSDKIAIYSGDDATAVEFMLMGGAGNVSVTANVAPLQMAQLCRLAMAASTGSEQDKQQARDLNQVLAQLNNDLFVEANPIPVKWALAKMGLMGEAIRLPLTVLDAQYHAKIEAALALAKITGEPVDQATQTTAN